MYQIVLTKSTKLFKKPVLRKPLNKLYRFLVVQNINARDHYRLKISNNSGSYSMIYLFQTEVLLYSYYHSPVFMFLVRHIYKK